jgi:hypothetical protein
MTNILVLQPFSYVKLLTHSTHLKKKFYIPDLIKYDAILSARKR